MDGVRTMRQKTREQRRKLMRKQKLYGLVFVLLSIFVVIMCMTGKNGGRSRCYGYRASSPLWAVFNLYEKDLHLRLIPVDEQRKV